MTFLNRLIFFITIYDLDFDCGIIVTKYKNTVYFITIYGLVFDNGIIIRSTIELEVLLLLYITYI